MDIVALEKGLNAASDTIDALLNRMDNGVVNGRGIEQQILGIESITTNPTGTMSVEQPSPSPAKFPSPRTDALHVDGFQKDNDLEELNEYVPESRPISGRPNSASMLVNKVHIDSKKKKLNRVVPKQHPQSALASFDMKGGEMLKGVCEENLTNKRLGAKQAKTDLPLLGGGGSKNEPASSFIGNHFGVRNYRTPFSSNNNNNNNLNGTRASGTSIPIDVLVDPMGHDSSMMGGSNEDGGLEGFGRLADDIDSSYYLTSMTCSRPGSKSSVHSSNQMSNDFNGGLELNLGSTILPSTIASPPLTRNGSPNDSSRRPIVSPALSGGSSIGSGGKVTISRSSSGKIRIAMENGPTTDLSDEIVEVQNTNDDDDTGTIWASLQREAKEAEQKLERKMEQEEDVSHSSNLKDIIDAPEEDLEETSIDNIDNHYGHSITSNDEHSIITSSNDTRTKMKPIPEEKMSHVEDETLYPNNMEIPVRQESNGGLNSELQYDDPCGEESVSQREINFMVSPGKGESRDNSFNLDRTVSPGLLPQPAGTILTNAITNGKKGKGKRIRGGNWNNSSSVESTSAHNVSGGGKGEGTKGEATFANATAANSAAGGKADAKIGKSASKGESLTSTGEGGKGEPRMSGKGKKKGPSRLRSDSNASKESITSSKDNIKESDFPTEKASKKRKGMTEKFDRCAEIARNTRFMVLQKLGPTSFLIQRAEEIVCPEADDHQGGESGGDDADDGSIMTRNDDDPSTTVGPDSSASVSETVENNLPTTNGICLETRNFAESDAKNEATRRQSFMSTKELKEIKDFSKKFRVSLGSPFHSCSCQEKKSMANQTSNVWCIHICWVLLKVIRAPRDHQLTWSEKLSDLDLQNLCTLHEKEITRKCVAQLKENRRTRLKEEIKERKKKRVAEMRKMGLYNEHLDDVEDSDEDAESDQDGKDTKQKFNEDDVCPICHDEFLQTPELALITCKEGCNQPIHVTCMQKWVEHNSDTPSCPLCRIAWNPDQITNLKKLKTRSDLQRARHLGTVCKKCKVRPIRGTLFGCLVCGSSSGSVSHEDGCTNVSPLFFWCEDCFHHPFRGHTKGNHPFFKKELVVSKDSSQQKDFIEFIDDPLQFVNTQKLINEEANRRRGSGHSRLDVMISAGYNVEDLPMSEILALSMETAIAGVGNTSVLGGSQSGGTTAVLGGNPLGGSRTSSRLLEGNLNLFTGITGLQAELERPYGVSRLSGSSDIPDLHERSSTNPNDTPSGLQTNARSLEEKNFWFVLSKSLKDYEPSFESWKMAGTTMEKRRAEKRKMQLQMQNTKNNPGSDDILGGLIMSGTNMSIGKAPLTGGANSTLNTNNAPNSLATTTFDASGLFRTESLQAIESKDQISVVMNTQMSLEKCCFGDQCRQDSNSIANSCSEITATSDSSKIVRLRCGHAAHPDCFSKEKLMKCPKCATFLFRSLEVLWCSDLKQGLIKLNTTKNPIEKPRENADKPRSDSVASAFSGTQSSSVLRNRGTQFNLTGSGSSGNILAGIGFKSGHALSPGQKRRIEQQKKISGDKTLEDSLKEAISGTSLSTKAGWQPQTQQHVADAAGLTVDTIGKKNSIISSNSIPSSTCDLNEVVVGNAYVSNIDPSALDISPMKNPDHNESNDISSRRQEHHNERNDRGGSKIPKHLKGVVTGLSMKNTGSHFTRGNSKEFASALSSTSPNLLDGGITGIGQSASGNSEFNPSSEAPTSKARPTLPTQTRGAHLNHQLSRREQARELARGELNSQPSMEIRRISEQSVELGIDQQNDQSKKVFSNSNAERIYSNKPPTAPTMTTPKKTECPTPKRHKESRLFERDTRLPFTEGESLVVDSDLNFLSIGNLPQRETKSMIGRSKTMGLPPSGNARSSAPAVVPAGNLGRGSSLNQNRTDSFTEEVNGDLFLDSFAVAGAGGRRDSRVSTRTGHGIKANPGIKRNSNKAGDATPPNLDVELGIEGVGQNAYVISNRTTSAKNAVGKASPSKVATKTKNSEFGDSESGKQQPPIITHASVQEHIGLSVQSGNAALQGQSGRQSGGTTAVSGGAQKISTRRRGSGQVGGTLAAPGSIVPNRENRDRGVVDQTVLHSLGVPKTMALLPIAVPTAVKAVSNTKLRKRTLIESDTNGPLDGGWSIDQ